MIILSPREQFQKFHTDQREEWAGMAGNRTLQLAFSYALADMGALGYSQEAMRGANLFIHHVLNLCEEQPDMATRYPAQPLQDETVKPV